MRNHRYLLLALCLAFPAAAQPARDLLAHWRFDSATDGVVADAAGNGHHATFFAKAARAPAFADGIHGQAVVLTGKDEQGFAVAKSETLNMTGPFTVMAWIRPNRRNASFSIVCMKGDKSGKPPWPGWRLRFAWARAAFQAGTPEGEEPTVSSPEWSVPPGFWSHVAATWDGRMLRVYVNAVEKASLPFAGPVAPQDPRRPMVLGNYIGRRNAYAFDGALDDIRIHSRCLSEDEILGAACAAE